MQDYKNKWALIVGGSSGLGLATAQKLASEGMHIIIVHRDRRSVLEQLAADADAMRNHGVEVITINKDAIAAEKRSEILTEIKNTIGENQIKVVVHSIARGNLKPMYTEDGTTLSSADFGLTLEAMATSLYDWVRDIWKANLFSNKARVLTFTSEGSTRAWHQYGAVAAAKAALESIIRSIALEYAPLGLTANAIQAGVTDTQSLRLIPGADEMKKATIQRNPHGRLTLPQDVANAVFLLCTDEASWINGAVIPVDGGEHIR